jgi:hypothetical protein
MKVKYHFGNKTPVEGKIRGFNRQRYIKNPSDGYWDIRWKIEKDDKQTSKDIYVELKSNLYGETKDGGWEFIGHDILKVKKILFHLIQK